MSVNWGDVPTWVAAVAAVAGVIGLGAQLRGVDRQIRLQTYSDYTRRYEFLVAKFPEDINFASFVLRTRTDYASVMRTMRSYFDLCFEEWDLNENCLITKSVWKTWLTGMKTAMSKPAFRQAWDRVKADSDFGDKFTKFLDDLAGRD